MVNVTDEVILHQNVIASGQIDASSTVGAGVDLFDVADFILLDRAPVDDERGLNTGRLRGAASCRDNAVNGIATDQETLAIRDQHTTEDILISRHGRTEGVAGNHPTHIRSGGRATQVAGVLDPEDIVVLDSDVVVRRFRVSAQGGAATGHDTGDGSHSGIAGDVAIFHGNIVGAIAGVVVVIFCAIGGTTVTGPAS